jgi:23S rRNA (adenine2503-C2)-methyltransferase
MSESPLPSLIGLSREEFAQILQEAGQPAFRAKQLWQWVYHRGAKDFSDMSNLAKELRQYLSEHYTLARPAISRAHISFDETRKWLLSFDDAKEAEMVYIPDDDRGALCVSSQVGCTLTCSFCHTGTMPLVRNLTAGEIVGQFMLARDELDEWKKTGDNRKLTTIVMMGMGEPLFNYDNVAKALKILMDAEGLGLSKRRITLSTSGVVPQIEQCGRELGVNLAISLHAVTDELRDTLVPLNKKWPIAALLQACRDYPTASNARRITFEYVMLKGINDSDADARALVKLVEGIPAKINLIPFNPWPGSGYECSSNNRIRAFAEIVNAAGFSSPVRTPRGRDILAACGQLKSDSERKRGEKVQL